MMGNEVALRTETGILDAMRSPGAFLYSRGCIRILPPNQKCEGRAVRQNYGFCLKWDVVGVNIFFRIFDRIQLRCGWGGFSAGGYPLPGCGRSLCAA